MEGKTLKQDAMNVAGHMYIALDHVAKLRTIFTAFKWWFWRRINNLQGACQQAPSYYLMLHTPQALLYISCTNTFNTFKITFDYCIW